MNAGDRRLDGGTDIPAVESKTTADCRAMPRITAHDNHCDQPQRRDVQKGIPEASPVELCYLGRQESPAQLATLVEPEIPG